MRLLVLATLLALPAVADETPRLNGVSLSAGGVFMANLHNELRVGATDVQLGWRHDFAWSTFDLGGEFMSFFNARGADPALGLRLGWGPRFTVGPVQLRGSLGLGGYWTRAAPVLPVAYVDLGVEKRFGGESEWTVGLSASGMLSLFGAGFQSRLTLARMF